MPDHTPELEAVARAIHDKLHPGSPSWDRVSEFAKTDAGLIARERRDLCIAVARAALMAIREPTERMYNAASDAGDCNSQQVCASIHYAMIDHILGETNAHNYEGTR